MESDDDDFNWIVESVKPKQVAMEKPMTEQIKRHDFSWIEESVKPKQVAMEKPMTEQIKRHQPMVNESDDQDFNWIIPKKQEPEDKLTLKTAKQRNTERIQQRKNIRDRVRWKIESGTTKNQLRRVINQTTPSYGRITVPDFADIQPKKSYKTELLPTRVIQSKIYPYKKKMVNQDAQVILKKGTTDQNTQVILQKIDQPTQVVIQPKNNRFKIEIVQQTAVKAESKKQDKNHQQQFIKSLKKRLKLAKQKIRNMNRQKNIQNTIQQMENEDQSTTKDSQIDRVQYLQFIRQTSNQKKIYERQIEQLNKRMNDMAQQQQQASQRLELAHQTFKKMAQSAMFNSNTQKQTVQHNLSIMSAKYEQNQEKQRKMIEQLALLKQRLTNANQQIQYAKYELKQLNEMNQKLNQLNKKASRDNLQLRVKNEEIQLQFDRQISKQMQKNIQQQAKRERMRITSAFSSAFPNKRILRMDKNILDYTNRKSKKELNMSFNSFDIEKIDQKQFQVGNTTISIDKIKQTNKVYIGTKVQKQNESYFTHRSVKVLAETIPTIKTAFYTLKNWNSGQIRFNGTDVMMKKDVYKGNIYYGIRHYNWYDKVPQVTRYGFNLTEQQMMKLVNIF